MINRLQKEILKSKGKKIFVSKEDFNELKVILKVDKDYRNGNYSTIFPSYELLIDEKLKQNEFYIK